MQTLLNDVVVFAVEICLAGTSKAVRTICFLRSIPFLHIDQRCEVQVKSLLTAASGFEVRTQRTDNGSEVAFTSGGDAAVERQMPDLDCSPECRERLR